MAQEEAFFETESDAWIRRNPPAGAAPPDDAILSALAQMPLPDKGALLDAGGASGRIAAGFLRDHPGWSATVVEASGEAIAIGKRASPDVRFEQGSITRPILASPEGGAYDIVVVSGVLCWIDRALLSHAIASTDAALKDGGLLVIADFDAPHLRANPYVYREGLFTYKQDYAACYLGLGIYHLEYRRTSLHRAAADESDPYDRQWMTAVLRKDLFGRYARS